jgi:imidazolonepropionase
VWDRLILAPRAWTATETGLIEGAAVGISAGRIAYVGPAADLPDEPEQLAHRVDRHSAGLLTPGLVDCHTHLVFAGDRADEFAERQRGTSYAQIAARGGGILATVRATRAASVEALVDCALPRLRQLIADGVTSVDIKSGYGLDLASERRQLLAARELGRRSGIAVRTSYLALHACPTDMARAEYLDRAIDEWLPTLHGEGLIDAVDAYHEHLAFTADEVDRLFRRAVALGVPVRLHADQLSNQHGAALAAAHRALSADHLEYTDADGVAAMAAAGTVAVILPAAFLVLREKQLPPIAAFRHAGVPMAIASDLNPGTSPMLSVRLAMSLAVSLFSLTVEEVLLGATVHGARALGLAAPAGTLSVGAPADLVVWAVDAPSALVYWLGGELSAEVVAAGRTVFARR